MEYRKRVRKGWSVICWIGMLRGKCEYQSLATFSLQLEFSWNEKKRHSCFFLLLWNANSIVLRMISGILLSEVVWLEEYWLGSQA